MSIEDDAHRAVRAFFLGETGWFGPYQVTSQPCLSLRYDGLWLLLQRESGEVIWFPPFRGRKPIDLAFNAAEQVTGLTLSVESNHAGLGGIVSEFPLGPLGLAALHASLTTTTVGD